MGKSTPYTQREKLLLASLVQRYSKIVENKATDGSTSVQKKESWQKIASLYNSQPEVVQKRQPEQLRKLWDNLKQRRRKENTVAIQGILRTGGGPPSKTEDDPVMAMVDMAVPHLDVIVEDAPWDSNGPPCRANHNEEEMTDSDDAASDEPEPNTSHAATEPDTAPVQEAAQPRPRIGAARGRNFKLTRSLNIEQQLRVQKLQESIAQQKELHEVRLQAAKMELELVSLKLQKEKEANRL